MWKDAFSELAAKVRYDVVKLKATISHLLDSSKLINIMLDQSHKLKLVRNALKKYQFFLSAKETVQ